MLSLTRGRSLVANKVDVCLNDLLGFCSWISWPSWMALVLDIFFPVMYYIVIIVWIGCHNN